MSQIVGLDVKAAGKSVRKIINNLSRETPIRMLGGTFQSRREDREAFEALVKAGFLDLVWDSVWRKSHRHGDTEKLIAMEDLIWMNGIATTGNQQLYHCPFLESSYLDKPVATFRDFVAASNGCIYIVNNPWRGKYLTIEGVLNCKHPETKASGDIEGAEGWYIYSEDGKDSKNRNVQQKLNRERKSGADLAFIWFANNNFKSDLQNNGGAPTPAPEDRDPRALSKEMIQAQEFMANNKRGKVSLSDKYIWKAYAEQKHIPPAERENKPVFISPEKFEKVWITNLKKKAKRVLAYTGREHGDGRHIYRLNEYGYEVSAKYLRQTGKVSALLWGIKNGRAVKIGRIAPAWRANDYK